MLPASVPATMNHPYTAMDNDDDKGGKKNSAKRHKTNSQSCSSGEPLSINSDYEEKEDITTCCCCPYSKNKVKAASFSDSYSVVSEKSAMISNKSDGKDPSVGSQVISLDDMGDDYDDESTCSCCFGFSKKLSKVDPSAIEGCSSSMEGSTLRRRSGTFRRRSHATHRYYSHPAVKGMKNLGNTCYLSSILQCLNQTVEVFKLLTDAAYPQKHDQHYLIVKDSLSQERITVSVDKKIGPLGKALYHFFTEINYNESRTVVKPTRVLSAIRQCNTMYQGHFQQDSHEVFRTILDCIRNEECEKVKQAIYNYFGVSNKSMKQTQEEEQGTINVGILPFLIPSVYLSYYTSHKLFTYLRRAQKYCKLVWGVFGGKVVDIIICRECNSVISIEEEFFDLSVPVATRVEKTPDCYSHSFEFPNSNKSSNYLTATSTSKGYEDAYEVPEQQMTTTAPIHVPGSKSPTLSRPSTNSFPMQASIELSVSSVKKSATMPNASYLRTNTGQKQSMPTDEFLESNKSFDSVHSGTIKIPHMTNIPSMTKPTKPANEGHHSVTTAIIENEPIQLYQPPVVAAEINNVSGDDKLASSSSALGGSSAYNSSGASTVKGAQFTINENLLQLHLKKEQFPYRVLRRNVDTDLEAGLQAYFELDVLDEHNKFMCDVCTAERLEKQGGYTPDATSQIGLSEVSKQISIAYLPEILVFHMKRFNLGQRLTKSTINISFPLILDVAPYCTNDCLVEFADSSMKILYGLYAVVEHRGSSLSGGHYVAYIRRRDKKLPDGVSQPSGMIYNEDEAKRPGDWYFVNDRHVKKLPGGFEDIKRCQAYMLFYERLPVVQLDS